MNRKVNVRYRAFVLYFCLIAALGSASAEISPRLVLEQVVGGRQGKILNGISMAVADSGTIFVLMGDEVISAYAPDGRFLKSRHYDISGGTSQISIQPVGEHILICNRAADFPFLSDIARKGPKPGQFESPQDALIAPDDRIFVADTGNDRIQVFGQGKAGEPEAVLDLKSSPFAIAFRNGKLAILTGKRGGPTGLSVYEEGPDGWKLFAETGACKGASAIAWGTNPNDLYILNGGESQQLEHWQVAKDQINKVVVLVAGLQAEWPQYFQSEVPLVSASDNSVWWADTSSGSVLRWDPKTSEVQVKGSGMKRPMSVGFAPVNDGKVYVGTASEVLVGSQEGREGDAYQVYLPRKTLSQESEPRLWGLLPDRDGGMYVRIIEGGNKQGWPAINIDHVSPNKKSVEWKDYGRLFSKYRRFSPANMRLGYAWCKDGNIAFAALPLMRVSKITPEGETLWVASRYPEGGADRVDMQGPSDVTVDSEGRIWVIDSDTAAIYCLSPEGKLLLSYDVATTNVDKGVEGVSYPTGIAAIQIDGKPYIVVGDSQRLCLLMYRVE